jgi:hypothetical protein
VKDELARREAWRSAAWASALDLGTGVLVTIALGRSPPGIPQWPLVQFAGVGALILAVLLVWRGAPRPASLALLSVDFAAGLVAALVMAHYFARAGVTGSMYQATKVSVFVIAILSPSTWLGAAWITVFAAIPFVEALVWPGDLRNALGPGEPWLTPIFGAVALAILFYRRRGARLAHALSEARARQLTVERLARMSLAVHDLANTPLQTLTTGVDLLASGAPPEERLLAAMMRALARLEQLKRLLTPFEPVEWLARDASFDAVTRLEQLARELSQPEPPESA